MPVLWVLVHLKGHRVSVNLRFCAAYFSIGAMNNAVPFLLIFWSKFIFQANLPQTYTITAMMGAVVAGILLRDELLTLNKISGALIVLLGVVLIIGPSALEELSIINLAELAVWVRQCLMHLPMGFILPFSLARGLHTFCLSLY